MMWDWIIQLIAFLILVQLIRSDLIFRLVHLISLLLWSICLIVLWSIRSDVFAQDLMYNALFLTFQFVITGAYIWIRNQKKNRGFKDWIGLGDVVFISSLCFYFSFDAFLLFYCGSLVFSILFYLIFKNQLNTSVPLVATTGIYLVLFDLSTRLNL